MPDNLANMIISSVFVGIGILASVKVFMKVVANHHAPVETVKAVVIDKQKVESFSKYTGNGKNIKYVVLFSADGRKRSYYVSEFSYNGYRVNQKGKLKFKGDRLIEFK